MDSSTSLSSNVRKPGGRPVPERGALKLAGLFLVFGFFINLTVTMLWHPTGSEDDHPEIFTEYANSDGWILTHLGQFLGVILALAGLYVLSRLLDSPDRFNPLTRLAGFALIATGTAFAILQAVDGIALKYATEAWLDSSGAQQEIRFADAETVRWTEWGIQSYFRILLGLSLLLIGAAAVTTRVLAGWLGWLAVLAGVLSIAVGVDVGYSGLESGFQDSVGLAAQVVLAVFAIGVLVAGYRGRDPGHAAPA